ncbi:MAG: AMP-binding protein [Eubacteriales bacterium]|nr:hypothetical protein [Sarcina sp.]MDO4417120.1 AMP-binding protein [Eubacteriales bacterium]
MITKENIHTLGDLLETAALDYENQVFIRYEKDGIVYEKGYRTFAMDTRAVSHWTMNRCGELGKRLHAALIGKCSYEYLTVLMGVAAAGSVAIPLDVQLSKEAFVENLNRAEADIVFFDYEYLSEAEYLLEACDCVKEIICIQQRKHHFSAPQIHREYRVPKFDYFAEPGDCAVVIFTSGTTGHGKGVMLSHANLLDNMFSSDDARETCLSVLPIHHVFCISGDLLLILRYGSTLCLCDDISKFLYYIDLFQPTMMRIVPMMAKMLLTRVSIAAKKHPEQDLDFLKSQIMGSRLHKIVSGGGYLSGTLAQGLAELGVVTGQGYGMTECAPKISAPDYGNMDKIASVGRPVRGCQIRFVDGEIQVKSPSVMMGYINDPELTAEALTEDGWLCTGDLGYMDEDGYLYLNGRKKNLIILSNGENVSPELIENRFDGDRLIQDIIAFGEGDTISVEVYPNFEYAQAQEIRDIPAAINEIIAMRNEELPSYAKISGCTVRKVPFEKTSSKKIIRKIYFDNKEAKAEEKKNLLRPATDLQRQISEVVTSVLSGEEIGTDANLYQNGLDSLASVMLIEELQTQLGISVTLTELMEYNTILKLEELALQKQGEVKVDYSPRPVYPLTSMMMYFSYVIAGNTTGNLPFVFRLDDSVDLPRLRAAFQELMNVHPALKAIIKPTENRYYAVFRDDARQIDIPVYRYTESEVEQRLQEMLVPFRYREDDDLVHIALVQTEAHKYMFFDVAHVIGDGITMNILMEDLKKIYDGVAVPKEKYTFYEYILDAKAKEDAGVREKDSAAVDRLMKGYRMRQTLLTRHDRQDCTKGVYGVIRRRLDRIVRKEILYYCKKYNVSENALFLSAFNYTAALFSDEEDIFVNSIHSGRTDGRWTGLAGCLFKTYLCRYERIHHEKVDELITRTGSQIMETMKNYSPVSRMGDLFLQYQGDILSVPTPGDKPGERMHCLQLDSLPFHMQIMFDEDGFYTELRYWENRFDRQTLEIFLTCYEEIVRAMMEETSVHRLKQHLPRELCPLHFRLYGTALNKAAGFELLPGVKEDRRIKIYILDEDCRKKPYGAWGPLYVMDYQPAQFDEVIENPYGPGTLYATGLKARILPDGTVDFLDQEGREVMTDGVNGRRFFDLVKAEEALKACAGIRTADAYLKFNPATNEMNLYADVTADAGFDREACLESMKQTCAPELVPVDLMVV